jgi:hypothetical protein
MIIWPLAVGVAHWSSSPQSALLLGTYMFTDRFLLRHPHLDLHLAFEILFTTRVHQERISVDLAKEKGKKGTKRSVWTPY